MLKAYLKDEEEDLYCNCKRNDASVSSFDVV